MPKEARHDRKNWKFLPLALALPLWLQAADSAREERTFETTPNPHISLSNLKGQVVVKGWDKPQVHVEWTNPSPQMLEVDQELMPATGTAERIHLTTHARDSKASGSDQTVDYVLDVPVGSCVEVRNPQGSVRIERLQGDAWVDTVGATISVTEVAGHLAARSMGGNIEIVRPSGRVEASTITGNLRFVAPAGSELRANTTSGKITYEGDFVSGADYLLSAYSGDVDVICPPSASFELSAKTVRGKVHNELPLTPKRHLAVPVPGASSLFGTHNNGRATLQLTSFSGTIRILTQP